MRMVVSAIARQPIGPISNRPNQTSLHARSGCPAVSSDQCEPDPKSLLGGKLPCTCAAACKSGSVINTEIILHGCAGAVLRVSRELVPHRTHQHGDAAERLTEQGCAGEKIQRPGVFERLFVCDVSGHAVRHGVVKNC